MIYQFILFIDITVKFITKCVAGIYQFYLFVAKKFNLLEIHCYMNVNRILFTIREREMAL